MALAFARRASAGLPNLPCTHRICTRVNLNRTRTFASGTNGHLSASDVENMGPQPLNVLGGPLECCCTSPVTGYYRDGYCKTDESDRGRHVICARVTQEFLDYSKSRGNDLMTPGFSFPGLKPGDKWCLCASRWKEALEAGRAPPVFLKCTHAKALEYVSLDSLRKHALDAGDAKEL